MDPFALVWQCRQRFWLQMVFAYQSATRLDRSSNFDISQAICSFLVASRGYTAALTPVTAPGLWANARQGAAGGGVADLEVGDASPSSETYSRLHLTSSARLLTWCTCSMHSTHAVLSRTTKTTTNAGLGVVCLTSNWQGKLCLKEVFADL